MQQLSPSCHQDPPTAIESVKREGEEVKSVERDKQECGEKEYADSERYKGKEGNKVSLRLAKRFKLRFLS